jgi:cell wall assembly regulator SMI1
MSDTWDRLRDIWDRIEEWLVSNAPEVLDSLNPGASDDEFQRIEATLGVSLPASVRAAYSIHNGQAIDPAFGDSPGFVYGWALFSLDRIEREWKCWHELVDRGDFDGIAAQPDGPITPLWWNTRWIPIAGNDSGDHYCLDLDPAPGGAFGQIISTYHDDPYRGVVAENFYCWMARFAEALQAGEYLYSEDHGGLVTVEEFEADREALAALREAGKL